MTYTELYKSFKQYTDLKEFFILNVKIENINYQGRDSYVFVHDNIRYFCLNNYDKPLTDDIQIKIYKDVKKLIRKRKIKEILDENL